VISILTLPPLKATSYNQRYLIDFRLGARSGHSSAKQKQKKSQNCNHICGGCLPYIRAILALIPRAIAINLEIYLFSNFPIFLNLEFGVVEYPYKLAWRKW
jgi:hypothetical protein|tara:strand:+ start:106 stop:408 length:303 start_codon:yes stop_codon:yes gene_type:complete